MTKNERFSVAPQQHIRNLFAEIKDNKLKITYYPKNKLKKRKKLIVWITKVAIAAPLIPSFNTNINIGSRMIFRMPPILREIIEKKAFPSARKILFSTKEAAIKGAP